MSNFYIVKKSLKVLNQINFEIIIRNTKVIIFLLISFVLDTKLIFYRKLILKYILHI